MPFVVIISLCSVFDEVRLNPAVVLIISKSLIRYFGFPSVRPCDPLNTAVPGNMCIEEKIC